MTAGLAVVSFFVGAALAIAMRAMYDLVERRYGGLTGAYHFGVYAVVALAYLVPSMPGSHYRSDNPGVGFLGISLIAWEIIALALMIVVGGVCSAVIRGCAIMEEINASQNDCESDE